MNDKIVESDIEYEEINDMFNFLKSYIRKKSKDVSKLGQAGWTPEELRKYGSLRFSIQDGGYSSTIISLSHDFNIMSGYTNSDGSFFLFWKGDIEKLRNCFNEFSDVEKKEIETIH